MSDVLLLTKLFIPPARPDLVLRPRLVDRLNEGLSSGRKLTLISASAGFGKTTLVSDWVNGCGRRVAWLSLDEGDNDPVRFISYLIAALQTIRVGIGEGLLAALQSPQPPLARAVLTSLLNEISDITENFLLILDDYHLIDSQPIDQLLGFLIERQPPQMHMVIATREDPSLPLARLRGRGQCTELRTADLRFTPAEAADFLNRVMRLNLSENDVAVLAARTEGWIAGLQMAAISMQGLTDMTGFIQSFTGSHRFVLDYLLEEVLQRQPVEMQTFLTRTSILERLCGPLCDAVLRTPSGSGDAALLSIERANLFVIPLDHERCWYRYHHLFAELLQQRLQRSDQVAEYHIRASEWYENNDHMLEAFHHAVAANDLERSVRLMEDRRMPIHIHSVARTILNWLGSLPTSLLDARPALWWKQASLLLLIGQTTEVEAKIQAAEAALAAAALPGTQPDATSRNLIGKMAVARATLAQLAAQAETILVQAHRALEYLHPNNLPYRSTATRLLGFACYLQEDRAAASRAYTEALSIALAAGDIPNAVLASVRLGQMQEVENQLYLAAETYRQVLQKIGDYSPLNFPVVYTGLARIYYEWNDLDAAEQYGELGLHEARKYDQIVDRLILSELFLSRLKLARGDVREAASILTRAEQMIHQKNYTYRLPDVTATRVMILLHQGNLDEAVQLAGQFDLPLLQARLFIAIDDPFAALAILIPFRQKMEAKGLADERLRALVLQALALHLQDEKDRAMSVLEEALALAEPGGFIRLFVDKGVRMAEFLSAAAAQGIRPGYVGRLLAAFNTETKNERLTSSSSLLDSGSAVETLTQREIEVLQLIAEGLSNLEIGARLYLALDTVKGHNRRIFEKLHVQRRTEAIARARELGLI